MVEEFGGEVGELGGEASPPPPPVDETLNLWIHKMSWMLRWDQSLRAKEPGLGEESDVTPRESCKKFKIMSYNPFINNSYDLII